MATIYGFSGVVTNTDSELHGPRTRPRISLPFSAVQPPKPPAANSVHPFRIAVILALLALPQCASAQVIQPRPGKLRDQWIFNMSGFGAVPVGEFRNHEKVGGGFEIALGFQPFRRQPLVLRSTLGSLMYDRWSRNEDQEFCDVSNNCTTETVFYDSHQHFMSLVQAGPEFMATDGRWRPYGFALAGVTFFNSTSRFGNAASTSSNPKSLFSSRNPSSTYGLGVRLVTSNYGREGGWDFGVRFTRNTKASYLSRDGVFRRSDGSYDVTPRSGAANILTIHIGVTGGPFVNWNER